MADGATTTNIGKLNLKMMRENLDGITHAPDNQLIFWMRLIGERCKMIIEPTGALGLGGLESMIKAGQIKDGARVGIIITGGNVDLQKYSSLMFGQSAQC